MNEDKRFTAAVAALNGAISAIGFWASPENCALQAVAHADALLVRLAETTPKCEDSGVECVHCGMELK